MTGLGLLADDFRVVTVQIGLQKAERWADAACCDGYGDDLVWWLCDLADKRAKSDLG